MLGHSSNAVTERAHAHVTTCGLDRGCRRNRRGPPQPLPAQHFGACADWVRGHLAEGEPGRGFLSL